MRLHQPGEIQQRLARQSLWRASMKVLSCLLFAGLGVSASASAYQSGVEGTASTEAATDSTVVYDAAFFEPFAPITLEDMIRAIPGGASLLNSLRRSSGDRGFGSDGPPLLIDGRRMTGKSNDIVTRLARIQASQVERIELLRGNAEGLDIRSDGVLYNVILKGDSSSTNFVDLRLHYSRGAAVGPRVLVSHSGRRGALEYGASYQFENKPRINRLREDVLAPDRTPLQFRDQVATEIEENHTVTANIGYEFSNGVRARLNGLYSDNVETDSRDEDQFLIGAGDERTFFAVEDALFRLGEKQWEVGGDLEASIGALGSLKTLFVVTRTNNDRDQSQGLTENGVRTSLFTQVADFDEGETIFRGSITTPIGGRHSIEYGGEGAFNTLDTTFSFNDGAFENAIVEEDRYDAFVTHNFEITDRLNLQSGVTREWSTILQNRDGISNERSFSFLKPRVELRYDITASQQVRLLAERTVSQLNLNDFVASRNIDDELVNFGNPNLSPESTWRYSFGYERRLKDDGGAIQIEFYYEDISDHIDKVLIGTSSSGIGNIGDARAFGVNTELNMRLGGIGLPNAVFTLQYDYQNTETTDPFTGETRLMRRKTPHYWDFDFRHDIAGTNFAYGLNGHRRTITRRQDVSLREVTRFKRHVAAYGEYNLTRNIKLRFTAHRFLGDERTADKTFYVGNIVDGVIDRIDVQRNTLKTQYDLRLQGAF